MKISAFAILPTIALLGASVFTVAYGEDTTPSSGAPSLSSTSGTPDDPNEIVCRRGEPVTGSRFPAKSVCHTRQQWKDMQQQSRDELTRVQTDSATAPLNGAPGH
jgi:hypothetical protein